VGSICDSTQPLESSATSPGYRYPSISLSAMDFLISLPISLRGSRHLRHTERAWKTVVENSASPSVRTFRGLTEVSLQYYPRRQVIRSELDMSLSHNHSLGLNVIEIAQADVRCINRQTTGLEAMETDFFNMSRVSVQLYSTWSPRIYKRLSTVAGSNPAVCTTRLIVPLEDTRSKSRLISECYAKTRSRMLTLPVVHMARVTR
jgi:hypothetical protein